MGCGSSKNTATTPLTNADDKKPDEPAKPTVPVPKPVAFDIKLDDEQSIIKKHPPKRLQRFDEQPAGVIVSEEVLNEKQRKAEERRLEILQERVSCAQKTQRIFNKGSSPDETIPNGISEETDETKLTSD